MTLSPIPVYVINLEKRTDRKDNILKEFHGKNEFSLSIVTAFEHKQGTKGLWKTIQHIISHYAKKDDEYIIICEDDIQFSTHYTPKYLHHCIQEAKAKGADLLLGGVSWYNGHISVTSNLYWAEQFTGLHFTVIFRKFFNVILNTSLHDPEVADYKIASLSNDVLFMYPFIATQREFGYSDVTSLNNEPGRVEQLFNLVEERVHKLERLSKIYQHAISTRPPSYTNLEYDSLCIPTYVINLPERTDRLMHIKSEFEGRKEFNVTVIEACKHHIGAFGLWLSIRKIVGIAMENNDDVILICEDDHQFTNSYSKEYLLQNILEAHHDGIDYLSGGTGRFDCVVPITSNRYWVSHCLSTQFIILYKKFFTKILNEPYDESTISDLLLSSITSQKMLLYPFVSIQKNFGYSDITPAHNEDKELITRLFSESMNRLQHIQQAHQKYASFRTQQISIAY
ncbi:hypothetical protein SAMN04488128_10228 [Chitinophaga eiseniae]|uniref:Glycosyltransferase involved in LPS biosynthesis, GR25 family n=1 Tax=Chitinophaga eiseniae TaxID=634771 RepID=A0A1T4PVI8_9BACT|nr:hypothetical protein [Chitinophaga eiseniae]SJZ95570.1 hypothetical protein SAMN04488128_10228 [Chitinophaga eiseniae]